MTAEQIINTAIYNERLAMEHYTALSEVLGRGGNKSASEFFLEQGKREKGHFNSLMKYKEKNFPDSHVAAGETVKWITGEVTAESGTQAGLADALTVVEMAEKTAEKFYRDALRSATDKESKELFEKLANDEARHFQIMGRIRALLEAKGKIEPEDLADLGMD